MPKKKKKRKFKIALSEKGLLGGVVRRTAKQADIMETLFGSETEVQRKKRLAKEKRKRNK